MGLPHKMKVHSKLLRERTTELRRRKEDEGERGGETKEKNRTPRTKNNKNLKQKLSMANDKTHSNSALNARGSAKTSDHLRRQKTMN